MPRRGNGARRSRPREVSFRLTRAARTTAFEWLRGLTEETAYEWFKGVRFRDNGGAPVCPHCESTRHYDIASRPGWWKCAARGCRKQFSATSGTIFHSRKLSFLKLVTLIFHFADCAKGNSACELSLKFDTAYKTMWVNLMKLREAMSSQRDRTWLHGIVEMDGAYFGGKNRKRNMAEKRQGEDHRHARYQKRKRTIMVARERHGNAVLFAAAEESSEIAVAAAGSLVRFEANTRLVTDQSPAYANLELLADHDTVDHSIGYSVDGISTNHAESAFSRARRAEIGTYHHWSATWLDFYSGEMTWRENRRRTGNLEQATDIVALGSACGQSRDLKGYWQHHQLPDDQLERPERRWARVHDQVRRP